ncbi:MAG: hypothetical protein QOH90_699, partial [Actinomycetota bacterium]|nr:hypothetical protein [Actinomycetota bacterium]
MSAVESKDSFAVEPRRAATLVLVRDVPTGMEVFLTIRPRHLRFMGGTAVFPGGALDPADLDERWNGLSSIDAEEAAELLGEPDGRVALGGYICAL